MKRYLLPILVLLTSFACLDAQSLVENAKAAYSRMDYRLAVESFEEYLAADGEITSDVSISLANSYYYLHEYENAHKYYAQTNEQNMSSLELLNYGEVLRHERLYSMARDKYYKAKRSDNKNIPLSRIYLAIKACDKAEKIDTDIANASLSPPVQSEHFSNTSVLKEKVGSAEFSSDGKTIYYTKLVPVNGKSKLKIYTAVLSWELGEWVNEKVMPFCDDVYDYAHPALSLDGKTLYFSSDMTGTVGGMDIFKVERNGNGWGMPQNLGSEINTEATEIFPYITPAGYLSFASNGHPGFGGLDAYWVEVKDGQPIVVNNADRPINSSDDDYATMIDPTDTLRSIEKQDLEGVYDDIYAMDFEAETIRAEEDSIRQIAYEDSLMQVMIAQSLSDSIAYVDSLIAEQKAQTRIDSIAAAKALAVLLAVEQQKQQDVRQAAYEDSLMQVMMAQSLLDSIAYVESLIAEQKAQARIDSIASAEALAVLLAVEQQKQQDVRQAAYEDSLIAEQHAQARIDSIAAAEASAVLLAVEQEVHQAAYEDSLMQEFVAQALSDSMTNADSLDEELLAEVIVDSVDKVNSLARSGSLALAEVPVTEQPKAHSQQAQEQNDVQLVQGDAFVLSSPNVLYDANDNGLVNTFLVDVLSSELLKKATYIIKDNATGKVLLSGKSDGLANIVLDLKTVEIIKGQAITVVAEVGYGDFSSYELELITDRMKLYDNNHPIMLTPIMGKRDQVKQNIVASEEVTGGAPFVMDSYELTPEGMQYLDAWTDFLLKNSTVKIKLMIHTDGRGEVSKNFKLSQQRASEVKRYLIDKGANQRQVIVRGSGERYPLVKCKECSDKENTANRRIEIEVVNSK